MIFLRRQLPLLITMITGLLQPRETRVLANPVASRSFHLSPTVSTPGLVVSGNF